MKSVIDTLFEEDYFRIFKVETQDLKKTDFWRNKADILKKLLPLLSNEQSDFFFAYANCEEQVQKYFAKRLYTLAFKQGFQLALELADKPNTPPKSE